LHLIVLLKGLKVTSVFYSISIRIVNRNVFTGSDHKNFYINQLHVSTCSIVCYFAQSKNTTELESRSHEKKFLIPLLAIEWKFYSSFSGGNIYRELDTFSRRQPDDSGNNSTDDNLDKLTITISSNKLMNDPIHMWLVEKITTTEI